MARRKLILPGKAFRRRPRPRDLIRFLKKVVVNPDAKVDGRPELGSCWDWTGCLDDNGYGSFKFDGKGVPAHRFSFQAFRPAGALRDGEDVDHVCTRPGCVNPDHLQPQTKTQSSRQGGYHRHGWTRVNGKAPKDAVAASRPDFDDIPI